MVSLNKLPHGGIHHAQDVPALWTIYIFYFQPSSWEDKQNVSNDERDMTVNDNEDLIYLFGGFLYFRGYPQSSSIYRWDFP